MSICSIDIASEIEIEKYNTMIKIGDDFLDKLKGHARICENDSAKIGTYLKKDSLNPYLHIEQMFLKLS